MSDVSSFATGVDMFIGASVSTVVNMADVTSVITGVNVSDVSSFISSVDGAYSSNCSYFSYWSNVKVHERKISDVMAMWGMDFSNVSSFATGVDVFISGTTVVMVRMVVMVYSCHGVWSQDFTDMSSHVASIDMSSSRAMMEVHEEA